MGISMFKGRERMLFGLFAGVIFMVVQALFPEIKLTEEQTLSVLLLIGAYIVGEGMSVSQMQFRFAELFKSQKFQMLLAGIAVVVINAFFPDLKITEDKLIELISLFSVFIVSAGYRS